MKSFWFVLLTAVLCSGQGVLTSGGTLQGGWRMPIADPLVSITITPPTATLIDGVATQYTAVGTQALGETASVTASSVWTVSDNSIATVGTQGGSQVSITCVGVGTVVVTSTVGSVHGTAPLTCQALPSTGADNLYCNPNGTWKGATTDGGANLPTSCYYTALAGTPSNGTVRAPVSTLAALQTAYAAASCGDVIPITAGSSITGPWSPPGKGCADSAYITIKSTGVSNVNFPAEGTRNTPCASNVASLPNRAPYSCASPALLTAAIVAPASNNAVTMNGTDHIRFIGIEFTRVTTPGVPIFNIIDLGSANGTGTMTNHIIFDRTWIHGVNGDGTFPQLNSVDTSTSRGIYFAQANHIAVIDSYISDFYDNGGGGSFGSSNGNTDAQCFAGGNGSVTNSGWGIYKIVNNHCEASGEGILFGGSGGPALTPGGCTVGVNCNLDVPTDFEVRRNYFFKPLSWNGNTTSASVSTGWPVEKNGFEMKTGARALIEGNLVENTWYQAQVGWAWTLAPKNQSDDATGTLPTAPTALTNDFTYRYNYGYNVANGPGYYQTEDANCVNCAAQGMNRVSVHDNLVDDALGLYNTTIVPGNCCTADELAITSTPDAGGHGLNKLQNLNFQHNTFVRGGRYLLGFGAGGSNLLFNITFQNNIWSYAQFGFGSNPSLSGCSTTNNFLSVLNACVTGFTVDHNAVFNWSTGVRGANWPTDGNGLGNFFYADTAGPGFTAYGSGDSLLNPSNYALTNVSPLHHAGSDGKDVGADISGLITALTNVRDSPGQSFSPGNLKVFPSSTTVELATSVPFSCDNQAGSNTCTWSIASGVGSISASGIYTAPNSGGSAVVQAINGSNLVTANVTVTGTTPAALGDCATGYSHRGAGQINTCTMSHTEFVGTATRKWEVVIPANYVSGQSGMVLNVGGAGHGLTATNGNPCGPPSSEVAGWASYLHTVPSPAPVVVCPEGDFASVSTERWNYIGILDSPHWVDGTTPNDSDFLRQLILITVRDLNLNPKKVYITMDWMGDAYMAAMSVQAAAQNSDLIAALGSYNDSNLPGLNTSFVSSWVGGLNTGQTLNFPAVPISVIMEPGVITLAGQAAGRSAMCGTNRANTDKWYHPLTVDSTFTFFDHTNQSTANLYFPNSVGTSFCSGSFDGNGNGLASSLQARKTTGGLLKTDMFAYRFVGNGTGAPWCSFDYSGADTLFCNNTGGSTARIALDLRVSSPCDFTHPCNNFLDAGTGSASASGYSPLDIMYKFFVNHPKP